MHDPMDESQLWKHEQCSTARISHKLTVNIHNKPSTHFHVQSVHALHAHIHTYTHIHDPKHNINIRFHTRPRLFKQIIKTHAYIKKNKYILIQIHAATQQREEPYATIKLREARFC